MEIDYKELNYLRKHTLIGPRKAFKVLALRDDAEKYSYMMEVYENCHMGIDYSEADALEYKYRRESWERAMAYFWLEYGDERTLEDFAYDKLHDAMDGKKLIR